MKEFYNSIASMEPMMPEVDIKLENLAFDLNEKSTTLKTKIPQHLISPVSNLIRSMNCYYSNFIEGHNTLPVDIERALVNDFSTDNKKRDLQLEAKAHIEVQKLIESRLENNDILDLNYIKWVHSEFYKYLPEELLWITNPETEQKIKVEPGIFRKSCVKVGKHTPPDAEVLENFLKRFKEVYNPEHLSKIKQLIAVAASHHRLLWIHPFYDGNGRVARLIAHAYFLKIGTGNKLWSISRGLARNQERYKQLLMNADKIRINDYDGRGNLSQQALKDFCIFFLETCMDQVEFMDSILQPNKLLERIETYINEQIQKGYLLKGSFQLIREAFYNGPFERGQSDSLTGYKTRQARSVVSALTKAGLLTSDTPKGPLKLGLPLNALDRFFPRLYPEV